MKIAAGSDHAGLACRQVVTEALRQAGHEVQEFGATDQTSTDYPDAAKDVACSVADGQVERGVLVCGTGMGMCMAANKVRGIRAALVHDEYTAIMASAHNNANVLCLGGRVINADLAVRLVELWLKTPYEGERHQKRIDKITKMEDD